jgi:hypothetical protein
VVASGCQHERGALKHGSSAGQSGSSQEKTGLRSETSVNDKAKPDAERSPKEVVEEQNKVPEAKAKTETEADHLVLVASRLKWMSRTTAPGMALAPHWCPPGVTPG